MALPLKINIGCGTDYRADYVNVDVHPQHRPDILIVNDDDSAIPRGYFEEVLARDVLEHIPRPRTMKTLLRWADYLVPGGRLMLETSEFFGVARKLAGNEKFASQHGWLTCLFGNQAHDGDFHFTAFTATTLRVMLAAAGYAIAEQGIRDEWLIWVHATKASDWTALSLPNERRSTGEFLDAAYRSAFGRDSDAIAHLHFGVQLEKRTMTRKDVLFELYSSEERLHVTAQALGL